LIFEKYIRLIILMGLLSHVCHGACCAQTPFDPALYQAYLNQIRILIALFSENSSVGDEIRKGTLYLSRPTSKNKQDEGKLKLVYLPPCLLDILVQGDYLIHHDREQDEVHYVSLDSTPFGFLLKPDISFSQNATVIHAESTTMSQSLWPLRTIQTWAPLRLFLRKTL